MRHGEARIRAVRRGARGISRKGLRLNCFGTILESASTLRSPSRALKGLMPDRYTNFAELVANTTEGRDFRVRWRKGTSGLVVIAPHGGGIEPGTSELADAVAGSDHSLYVFEGLRSSGSNSLHITSTRFDDPHCLALLAGADQVLALHGESSEPQCAFMGGLDSGFADRISRALAAVTTVNVHPQWTGMDPANICNRARSGRGVQVELSRGLRASFFASLKRDGRRFATPRFAAFVAAMRSALG